MRPVLFLLAILAMVLAGCGAARSTATDCERIPGVRPGLCPIPAEARQPAPTDAVEVLGEGGTLSIGDFEGQLVVVNFWASWCAPCRTEQPDLNELARALAGDVAFLGVNIQDSETNALAHWREFDVPYSSLFDPSNRYAAQFGGIGPRTLPSTILIDPEGRVAARIFGVTSRTEVSVLADRILTDTPARAAAL